MLNGFGGVVAVNRQQIISDNEDCENSINVRNVTLYSADRGTCNGEAPYICLLQTQFLCLLPMMYLRHFAHLLRTVCGDSLMAVVFRVSLVPWKVISAPNFPCVVRVTQQSLRLTKIYSGLFSIALHSLVSPFWPCTRIL